VHFGLGLNLGAEPLHDHLVNLSKVEAATSSNPAFHGVARCLTDLSSNSAFVAVEAVVNHSKHRGLIEPRLSVEPSGSTKPYEMDFGAFTYRSVAYAEQEVTKVLAPAYEAASKAVVDTGNAVNAVLA